VGLPITQDDLDIVRDCERALLTGAVRGDRLSAGLLLHPDYREFGKSGRVWDKESVLDLMEDTSELVRIRAEGLDAVPLGDDVVLVTYDSVTPEARAHRSSVWVRESGRWQVRFHQGTPVPPA
jgi:ribonuclease HI